MHIRNLLDNGRKRVNQLHKVISNRNINLSARRLLLLSVIRPSIEYGSEVWEGNKSQAGSLESIILDGAKRKLSVSSVTRSAACSSRRAKLLCLAAIFRIIQSYMCSHSHCKRRTSTPHYYCVYTARIS